MHICYKVVSAPLNAANYWGISPIMQGTFLCVIYKRGVLIEAPIGGLLAFHTLHAALSYAATNVKHPWVVWKALGFGRVQVPASLPAPRALRSTPILLAKINVRDAWNRRGYSCASVTLPSATVAYKRLALITPVADDTTWRDYFGIPG